VKFTVDIIPSGLWKKSNLLFEEVIDSWIDKANGKWRDVSLNLE